MNKKQIKKETRRQFKRWGLSHWQVTFLWDLPDRHFIAAISSQPEYHKVFINYNLDVMKTTAKALAKTYIRHEVLHAVLSPYTEMVKNLVASETKRAALHDIEETLVTSLESTPAVRGG